MRIRQRRWSNSKETPTRYGFVLTALAAIACSTTLSAPPPEDVDRREALIAAVEDSAPGQELELTSVLGGDWDRAVFLGPYYENDRAREDLGFDFDIEGASPWSYAEGGVVIVLARSGTVAGWLAVPSGDVGLHCLQNGTTLAANEAALVVVEDEDGYRSLIDPDRLGCEG